MHFAMFEKLCKHGFSEITFYLYKNRNARISFITYSSCHKKLTENSLRLYIYICVQLNLLANAYSRARASFWTNDNCYISPINFC